MKKIKFRAFLKNEGYMVDVLSIDFESESINHENIQTDNLLSTEPDSVVDPICFTEFKDIELMQFAGFKDKNGKEIYEGDIVKIVRWSGTKNKSCSISEVTFDNSAFMTKDNIIGSEFLGYNSSEILEVIGNIYENPELIEADDDANCVTSETEDKNGK